MREHLGAFDIANNISMLRGVFNGTIMIVEGPTDMRLFGKLMDEECEVIAAHSKDNVRGAVKELYNRRKDKKILGIMDSDLDRQLDRIPDPPLFITDTRDAEIMMIRSSALDHVLWEYADRNALEKFVEKHGEVRDAIINATYPLGLLMYISLINDHGLSFKDLDFSRFVDTDLNTDIRGMVDEVIYNTKGTNITAKTIRTSVAKEMETERDPWIVCRGHDAVEVLLLGLKKIFGGYNSKMLRSGELSGALRLAFDMKDLMQTQLFKDTEKWAISNGMKLWLTDPADPL